MSCPCIKINLNKIADNARFINDRCVLCGISVVGVTKSVLADINIVKILKKSGIKIFGDSRLLNLQKLRNYFGFGQELIMLRTPMLSECEELVGICDTSLQTELETVKLISKICSRKKIVHNIILMIEMDDRREGIYPSEVLNFFDTVYRNYKNINIIGLGTNARCISKKKPTLKSIENLISLRNKINGIYNYRVPFISGGNSSLWKFIASGALPGEVNQARIGEAIFIGNETAGYEAIEGVHQDSFILESEVIEVKEKKGEIYKAILALGLQDVDCKNIKINNPFYEIAGQSSDHTILQLKKEFNYLKYKNISRDFIPEDDNLKKSQINVRTSLMELNVGSIVSFKPDYFGLLSCMTSPFVIKKYIGL
ncbi:MAG: alanine racemase [Candidatus Humimicrobiaceae bacterium]